MFFVAQTTYQSHQHTGTISVSAVQHGSPDHHHAQSATFPNVLSHRRVNLRIASALRGGLGLRLPDSQRRWRACAPLVIHSGPAWHDHDVPRIPLLATSDSQIAARSQLSTACHLMPCCAMLCPAPSPAPRLSFTWRGGCCSLKLPSYLTPHCSGTGRALASLSRCCQVPEATTVFPSARGVSILQGNSGNTLVGRTRAL